MKDHKLTIDQGIFLNHKVYHLENVFKRLSLRRIAQKKDITIQISLSLLEKAATYVNFSDKSY